MTGKNSTSTSNELVHNSKLLNIITEKVTKEKHEHLYPKVGKDGTLKECKRLFKKGASSKVLTEVLTKLEELPEEQEKYYRYYVQHFLPVLKEEIKQSKELEKIKKEKIEQVISEITSQSSNKGHSDNIAQSRRGSMKSEDSGIESGNSSDAEDDHDTDEEHSISNGPTPSTANEDQEVGNGITGNSEDSGIGSNDSSDAEDDPADEKDCTLNAPIFHAIKNGNQGKFAEYLEDRTDISSVKDEEGNNILHHIALLGKEKKCKYLDTLATMVTKKDLAQLIDSKNQDGKTPLQAALIGKITKEKHGSHTIQDNDNTLKFLITLLGHGAKLNQLESSEKELQDLDKEQKEYYLNFLDKLSKSVKQQKADIEIKIKEIVEHTINTPDSNPLHLAIKNNDKKTF